MAYPGEPSGPATKGLGALAGGRLTADEFDQLAAAFRPSWEFDEAPFAGVGSMSPSDLQALQSGGGTHADVRAVAQATATAATGLVNGAHAPPRPAAPAHEPADSVIIDRSVPAADIAPPPPSVQPRPQMAAPVVPARAPASPDRLAQTRIIHRPAPVPAPRESTGSFDARALRSRRPLWIGLGVGGVALVAVGIWAASGSAQAPAPPVPAALVKTVQAAAPDIPPPPPEATPAPAAPPPKTVPISALAQVPAPVVAPPPPQAAARPVAAPVAPAPAPAPRPAVAPTPKPAARPKAGAGTIVHDVPF